MARSYERRDPGILFASQCGRRESLSGRAPPGSATRQTASPADTTPGRSPARAQGVMLALCTCTIVVLALCHTGHLKCSRLNPPAIPLRTHTQVPGNRASDPRKHRAARTRGILRDQIVRGGVPARFLPSSRGSL